MSSEYKVDRLNRRIKKSINGITKEYYLWYDQTHIAAILDENKIAKLTYIYGPESQISPSYVVKDGTTYKILHDPGLGSVRYIIDPSTQQIMQEVEYDENGNIMKNTNPEFQPILFSGGLFDFDTRLTRFGARDYDPTIGRWTTKDPIGFAGGDTNLYAYVAGNPMSYIDPSGLLAAQVGLSASASAFFGVQGEVGYAGLVNNNTGTTSSGTYGSGGTNLGLSIGTGAAFSFTVTPFANSLDDLSGNSYGGQLNLGFLGFQITGSAAGPAFNFSIGAEQTYGISTIYNRTKTGLCNGK